MVIEIFFFHLVSFAILSAFVIFFLLNNGIEIFIENWYLPTTGGSIANAIFLGFTASMLGVSGFESSTNFVEEQQKGVFPKTLKNMWLVVSIINSLAALFALSLFGIPLL
ncbi:amino acid permease [Psychroserpens burtonensis]|uniref:amino acid permease n=1 Tax=Psychroserpens burtonensis TaxID=49278 RepID=UPI001B7FB290|nr:amino acid permease [Psychroserpens burtonensis]